MIFSYPDAVSAHRIRIAEMLLEPNGSSVFVAMALHSSEVSGARVLQLLGKHALQSSLRVLLHYFSYKLCSLVYLICSVTVNYVRYSIFRSHDLA